MKISSKLKIASVALVVGKAFPTVPKSTLFKVFIISGTSL